METKLFIKKGECTLMIKNTNTSGHTTYNLKEYVVDTIEDIASLSINDPMGSTAFVIEGGKVFMMNGKKEWVEI